MKKIILAIFILISINLYSNEITKRQILGRWFMKKGEIKLIINFNKQGVFLQKVINPSRSRANVMKRTGKWKLIDNHVVLMYSYRKQRKKFIFKIKMINGKTILVQNDYRMYLRKQNT